MRSNERKLYLDPHTRHPIYNLDLPFAEYIKACKQLIRTTRADLDEFPEKAIEVNSPFELRPVHPPKAGVLLIHGLLDSPFIMKDIGMRLQNNGLLARGILLPGHGTVPGDLLNVSYKDWIQAVRYGIASLQKEVEHVYLIGFSTGATLALDFILRGEKIAGAVLLSPAIKIRSYFAFSSNWHEIISWGWERAKWLRMAPENDYAKYQSTPFNAAYQVYKLSREVKKLSQNKKTCPLLFALSLADTTVCSRASIKYFQKHLQPENKLIVYARTDEYKQAANTIARTSIYPDMHVYDFSHIAIPVSSNNPHYGKYGDSIYASRIDEKDKIMYGAFSKIQNMVYTFLYNNKLTKIKRKRLSYNPDFEFLVTEIEKFIASCELTHPKTT